MTKGYVGWALSSATREALLTQFVPVFHRVIAHHCTLKFGVDHTHALPSATQAWVVGEAVCASGVQALVLSVDHTTQRPGGGVYHITWSLAQGRTPVQSNQVIADQGWRSVHTPVQIDITPKFFPMQQPK